MGEKLKVLFAINCLNVGGAPAVVLEQARHLSPERFEPWVLTLYPSKAANLIGQFSFVPPERLVQLKLWRRSPLDVRGWLKIYRLIRRERFDVVYTHLFLANLVVRAAAIFARVPTIVAFEHSRYHNKRPWQRLADRLLSYGTHAIAVSVDDVADFTAAQEKIPRRKFSTIPNPTAVPPRNEASLGELRQRYGLTPESFVVVSIGRFSEEKGQRFLIQAAARVLEAAPQTRFLIVGHGPLTGQLQHQVEELGLAGRCDVAVEPQCAKEFLHLADVVALPSLREGQSMVTYEALAAGVPVVASDLPTLRQVIRPGVNGQLVPPGDSHALAAALVELAGSPERLAQLRRQAAGSVTPLTAEGSARKLERLIDELRQAREPR